MSAQPATLATMQAQTPSVSLTIVFVVGLLLGGAGVAIYYSQRHAVAAVDAPNQEQRAQQAAGKPDPRFFLLKPIVADLSGTGGMRHLKLTPVLKTLSQDVYRELETRSAEVTDRLLGKVRQLTIADIDTKDGGNRLKREMLQEVNELLEKGIVEQVLFTEFVIQ